MQDYPKPSAIATGNSGDVGTITETVMISAPGAGSRYRLAKASCTNTSAVLQRIDIRDGASGATLYEIAVPAGSATVPGIAREEFDPPLSFGENKAVVFFTASTAVNTRMSCVAFRERFGG